MSKILSHQLDVKYKKIYTNYTASPGDYLLVDTTASSFNVTLPDSPKDGSRVMFATPGTWTSTHWTMLRNGAKIEGLLEDCTADIDVAFGLMYVSSTGDWKIVS